MKSQITTAWIKEIEDLGEFRAIFNKCVPECDRNYLMELYFSPKNYGRVDFLVGLQVDDIDEEIEKLEKDTEWLIDEAEVSCKCNIGSREDKIDGVYSGILMDYFGYNEEELEELEQENKFE